MATISLYVSGSDANRIPREVLKLLRGAGFEPTVVKYQTHPGIPQLSPPSEEEKCHVDIHLMLRSKLLDKIAEGYSLFNLADEMGGHILIRVHGDWIFAAWLYPNPRAVTNARFLVLPLSHLEQSVSDKTVRDALAFAERHSAQWMGWPEAVARLAWDGSCP